MANWTRISGTHFTGLGNINFREETRNWYVRIEKPDSTITVKVYSSEANATAGNSNYAAYGTAAVGTALDYSVALSNNAPIAPTFTSASLRVLLDDTGSTGNEVWRCDLGKRIERALLFILRAFSLVTVANGYFTTMNTVERGLRQWEDTEGLRPYAGAALRSLLSQPGEIAGGPANFLTEVVYQCVAHVDPSAGNVDEKSAFLFHDLRRSIYAAVAAVYDGNSSGTIFDALEVRISEGDLDLLWARSRGSIEFQIVASIEEDETEVTTG